MSQALGALSPELWHDGRGAPWALGVLEEGAQTLPLPPALVHLLQVLGSSTDFSELRISRGVAEMMNLFCGYIDTPAASACLCRVPLPPAAPVCISPCFYFTSPEVRTVTFRDTLQMFG